jgi:hypothetical protein
LEVTLSKATTSDEGPISLPRPARAPPGQTSPSLARGGPSPCRRRVQRGSVMCNSTRRSIPHGCPMPPPGPPGRPPPRCGRGVPPDGCGEEHLSAKRGGRRAKRSGRGVPHVPDEGDLPRAAGVCEGGASSAIPQRARPHTGAPCPLPALRADLPRDAGEVSCRLGGRDKNTSPRSGEVAERSEAGGASPSSPTSRPSPRRRSAGRGSVICKTTRRSTSPGCPMPPPGPPGRPPPPRGRGVLPAGRSR